MADKAGIAENVKFVLHRLQMDDNKGVITAEFTTAVLKKSKIEKILNSGNTSTVYTNGGIFRVSNNRLQLKEINGYEVRMTGYVCDECAEIVYTGDYYQVLKAGQLECITDKSQGRKLNLTGGENVKLNHYDTCSNWAMCAGIACPGTKLYRVNYTISDPLVQAGLKLDRENDPELRIQNREKLHEINTRMQLAIHGGISETRTLLDDFMSSTKSALEITSSNYDWVMYIGLILAGLALLYLLIKFNCCMMKRRRKLIRKRQEVEESENEDEEIELGEQ